METQRSDIFESLIAIVSQNQAMANILKEQCTLYGFKNIRIFSGWDVLLDHLSQTVSDIIVADQFPAFHDDRFQTILQTQDKPQHSIPVVLYAQRSEDISQKEIPNGLTIVASLYRRDEQQRLVEVIHEELDKRLLPTQEFAPQKQKYITLVTSDRELREDMQQILEKEGYCVNVMADGKEVLDHFRTIPVSIVFLDYKLPKLSGLSLLHWFQSTHPEIVVVLMGEEDSSDLIDEFIKAGVYTYLKKPFDVGAIPILCQDIYEAFEPIFMMMGISEKTGEAGQPIQDSEEIMVLRKSEEHFRMLINASGDIIFRITPQGILNYASPAVGEQLGYTQTDLKEQRINVAKFVHPEDFMRVMANIRQVIRGMSIKGLECRLMHQDRIHFRWYSINCYPLYNSEHEFVGVGGIARDIVSIKEFEQRLRKQNERLAALNAIASIVSQSLDLDEILNNVIDKILEIIKLQAGGIFLLAPETKKLTLKSCRINAETSLKQCDISEVCAVFEDMHEETFKTDTPLIVEDISKHLKLSTTFLHDMGFRTFVMIPLKSKEMSLGIMALFTQEQRNITEEDRQLLMSISNQIGMTIENITLYQKEMKDRERLEELNKLKDDFVSIVSHDLRSPLTAILGSAEILLSEEFMKPPLTKEQQKLVTDIQTMGNHQLQLVNDLLDLAKIESGKLVLNRKIADIRQVAQQCHDTLKILAERKNITMNFVAPPDLARIRIDLPKISQVINNLLENAVKFTEPGGTVTLRAETEGQESLKISVSDTGKGIKPENLSVLFDKFQQLRTHGTTGERGTGLGLAICKNLIELHQGNIWVESRIGVGSTFSFILPIVKDLILIIDDSLFVIKSLEKMILENLKNIRVTYAENGHDGLQHIEEDFPVIIILDYMMPAMNGIEVFRELKKRYGTKVPPTIILTASQDLEVRRQIFELGAADYLQKPVDIHDLLPRLSRLL